MTNNLQIRITTKLERKDPGLPVYVVIPGQSIKAIGLAQTTVIEGSVNGQDFGRRTIKSWGKGRDDWFVEFTASFCKKAGLAAGEQIEIELKLADTSTPAELEKILLNNKNIAAAWEALTESRRREAGEHIRAAKSSATRERGAKVVAEKLGTKLKN